MAEKITRLPRQHRNYPHCASCDRELTVFDHLHMSVPADLPERVLKVTLQVECDCGAQWCLAKETT